MKLRTLLLLVILCSAASAQTTLKLGTPVERELHPGQVQPFTVELQENNFIQLVVEQRGIDVIVRVFSPSGKSLGEFDSPNGTEGPEHVSFVAVAAGSYQIHVGPLSPNDATKGRFQIKILEVRQATDQELKTSKNLEVTKAQGVALLADIEEIIPQIKSPQTRIKAQLQAGQLLWDIDQKRAVKLISDATTGFNDFLASADSDYLQFSSHMFVQLRTEIVLALATRDPDAALNFLHSTSQMIGAAFEQRDHFRQESALELAIADQILRNNPKRTLQMARQTMKQGYSSSLVNTLVELRRKDPELGAELADEMAAKVVNEKLLKHPEAAYIAAHLIRYLPSSDTSPESTNGTARPPLLPDERFRELVQKVFDEAISYSFAARQSYGPERDAVWNMLNALKSIAGQLDTIRPGGNAAVEKKVNEITNSGASHFGSAFATRPGEVPLEEIAKMPVEFREQQYIQYAYQEGNKGDMTHARQILNERVKNPTQRRHALIQLEQQEMYRSMNKGKAEEVIKFLNGFRNIRERAQQVSQIVNQIGPGRKRASTLNLLEQVRNTLSPSAQAQDQDQMQALLEVARAFSRYDVKRSFEIMDPLIEQFNELSAAARTLDGFGHDYYNDEELDLHNGTPMTTVATQMSSVLGSLAVVSFERAKATTDRIMALEVRLRIYLDIAQHTIQASR